MRVRIVVKERKWWRKCSGHGVYLGIGTGLVVWPESTPSSVWSYVRAHHSGGPSVIPLLPSPVFLRKGSRLFSLCLSSRKRSGVDGRAQCLDTDVAEPGLGPEPIVLYLATTGGYFCFCCLILSDIVSVPRRGRCVCGCFSLLIHFTILQYRRSIAAQRKSHSPYFHRDCLPGSILLW